jgi:adenylate cyclase
LSFFNELKRRNVFRVGIAYTITAWLIAQVAGLAADSFLAPDWVMKMIITLLILGAPVALMMAWAYELTPEGLRRESGIEPGQSVARANAGKLDRTITIVLVLAVAYFSYDKFVLDPRRDAALIESASRQAKEASPQAETTTSKSVQQEDNPSIAVLAFVNMSDDAGNEYFSEGISEELLNLLVRIPELRVAARTSSFSYKGKDTRIAQIGEELGVANVLEGSVRKSGNHVRITAQLIRVDDGFHLWSQTYDRTLDDIFVTQDEIAAAVVDALKVTLLGAMPEQRETDPEVYALYLQGKYFTNFKSEENLEKALKVLKQAVATDPAYAPAWIAMSFVYGEQLKYGFRPVEQAFTLAMAATEKALEIDPNMTDAWANVAYLKRGRSDWVGAEAAINKALKLDPNNSNVIGTAATLAGTFGQLDKSIELFERNVRLDPLRLSNLRALALRYGSAGRYDEALETFNRVLVIHPSFPWIHVNLATTYLLKGDAETALIELNKDPSYRYYASLKAMIFSTLGREAEAQALIRQLLEDPADLAPLVMARTYAWRGENDLAFEWLEKASQQSNVSYTLFLIRPWFRNLVSDPRFALFLEKIGLLEYWKVMPPEYGGPPEASG